MRAQACGSQPAYVSSCADCSVVKRIRIYPGKAISGPPRERYYCTLSSLLYDYFIRGTVGCDRNRMPLLSKASNVVQYVSFLYDVTGFPVTSYNMYLSCTTLLALLKLAIRFLSQPTVLYAAYHRSRIAGGTGLSFQDRGVGRLLDSRHGACISEFAPSQSSLDGG